MVSITDLAGYLDGSWELERVVTLHRTGQRALVTGSAEWRGADEVAELVYREQGLVRLDDFTGSVSRSYRFTFPHPSTAAVLFADGRPFYRFDLCDGRAEVEHLCGDDAYRGRIEAIGTSILHQRWEVRGPGKDYTSLTVLRARSAR